MNETQRGFMRKVNNIGERQTDRTAAIIGPIGNGIQSKDGLNFGF